MNDTTNTQALTDVIEERRRQIEEEGWSPERDDTYNFPFSLPFAASCYAFAGGFSDTQREALCKPGEPLANWPWSPFQWKPSTRRRDLVKAGALILAAIEYIDRATARAEAAEAEEEKRREEEAEKEAERRAEEEEEISGTAAEARALADIEAEREALREHVREEVASDRLRGAADE